MAKTAQHDDFGEKIGGAKKDLWKERGLLAGDLDEMNGREADKYVKKDNVWRKPDYDAMVEGGVPTDVAYFIKTVRDSLNAAPRYHRSDNSAENRLFRQKQYIETVRGIKEAIEKVTTREDAMLVFSKALLEGGYIERTGGNGGGYRRTEKGSGNPAITDKLFRALAITTASQYDRKIAQKAEREQFGVPKDQKIPRGYEIHLYSGNGYPRYDDWTPGTFFVTKSKSPRILVAGIEGKEAALLWIKEHTAERRGSKKRFTPEQLAHVRRTGADYREGRDATDEDFLSAFGFRGGEFGNWMNRHDRQTSLNMGFDALKDLSGALNITDKDISFGGTLAIAFGARGSGNAAAHYEPMRKVINLTKTHGAGSLAHEWWHGLDDFMGQELGAKGFLSDSPKAYPAMEKLIDVMKYKPETQMQAESRVRAEDAQVRDNAGIWLDRNILSVIEAKGDKPLTHEYLGYKESFLNGEAGSKDGLSELGKSGSFAELSLHDRLNTLISPSDKLTEIRQSLTGYVMTKDDCDVLFYFETTLQSAANRDYSNAEIRKTKTDFYKNSGKIGSSFMKDGGYWDSNTEMTARAFATYIMDKLPGKSDYLAGHAESAGNISISNGGNTETVAAFPQGAERENINAAFDDLISELKLSRHLTHEDRPHSGLTEISYDPVNAEQHGQAEIILTSATGQQGKSDPKPSVISDLAAAKEAGKIPPPKENQSKAPIQAQEH